MDFCSIAEMARQMLTAQFYAANRGLFWGSLTMVQFLQPCCCYVPVVVEVWWDGAGAHDAVSPLAISPLAR